MGKLQDEVEIIEMCLPLFNDAGGIWFRNNHNRADGNFTDWGAARAFATAARALPDLLHVVTELANASQSEATSRLRNMAQSALASHEPGRPVPHHGSGPDNQ